MEECDDDIISLNMMTPETVGHIDRLPAINSRELMLANGEYANKKTLQRIAYDAGLPVPRLLPRSAVNDLFHEWTSASQTMNSNEAYLLEERRFPYVRGFLVHPIDMWAVDVVPTTNIVDEEDIFRFESRLASIDNSSNDTQFLQRNFDVFQMPRVSYFFQEPVDLNAFYLSVWCRGDQQYCTVQMNQQSRGVLWIHFDQGRLYDVADGLGYMTRKTFDESVLPICNQANQLFNTQLGTRYDYKHDFMVRGKKVWLIQSRVTHLQTTLDDVASQRKKIDSLRQSGVFEINLEVSEFSMLPRLVADRPYVVRVTNEDHRGVIGTDTLMKMDLRGLQGLILPKSLRGGLLQHGGYNVIAYASYWGLPIVIEDY